MRLIDADKFCDIIDDKCLRLAKKLGYKSYEELSKNMKWYWDGISCAVGVVLDMPTVEPKTGHWIKISPAGIYECSQCGQNVMTGDIEVYAYCHHCGAYMKEDTDA